MAEALRALGLMSGTSMDGVDAAILRTDGERILEFGPWLTMPYEDDLRRRLGAILGGAGGVDDVARRITLVHADIIQKLVYENDLTYSDIDIIGFHGHTIEHRPEARRTRQIGDAALLARRTGLAVVGDFRKADVAAGGQGAPLAPLYHAALARDLAKPLAVLNIGGVANVTWIGPEETLLAFDTGPGNGLLDDWMRRRTGRVMDEGGALAAAGSVDEAVLAALLEHPHFRRAPPKSLDRLDFPVDAVAGLSPEDGAATLTAFTAAAVALARSHLPGRPLRWLVCGGGRRNDTLMGALREALGVPVEPAEAVGWRGDALEAEAFAYLAVRSVRDLPLTLPSTTGVARPLGGGVLYRP